MKCAEIQELLGLYFDLTTNDLRRYRVDEHIKHCQSCKEEFRLWQESIHLIRDQEFPKATNSHHAPKISNHVMQRIYSDESWRVPVHHRVYSMSYKLRRNVSAILAFCLTLFIFSFIYSVAFELPKEEPYVYEFTTGVLPVANAMADSVTSVDTVQGVPIASISDPLILDIGVIQSYPDYFVVVSLFGVICSLLILNWLSRIRV